MRRSLVLPAVVALSAALASCGNQAVNAPSETVTPNQTQTPSAMLPDPADGWKTVVPGGYERVTTTGVDRWATSLEGYRWILEGEKQYLTEAKTLLAQGINNQSRVSAIQASIEFLQKMIAAETSQGSIKTQAFSCSINANAYPISSAGGAKAYANTSCTTALQMSSHADATAGGRSLNNNDQTSTYRYNSGTSAYVEGAAPCNSYASAGVITWGYKSSNNYNCY